MAGWTMQICPKLKWFPFFRGNVDFLGGGLKKYQFELRLNHLNEIVVGEGRDSHFVGESHYSI